MKNKLIIFFILISSILSAQTYNRVTNGQGGTVTNGSGSKLVSSGKVNYYTASPSTFNILYVWDFENEELGEYTEAEVLEDFTPSPEMPYSWLGGDSIVSRTIDGVSTKVLKIVNVTGASQRGFQLYHFLDAQRTNLDSCLLSYRFMFDENWTFLDGNAKFPALFNVYNTDSQPWPTWGGQPAGNGFNGGFLVKAGGRMSDYHYNANSLGYQPWTSDFENGDNGFYLNDSAYFIPGVWYTLTQWIIMNTNSDDTIPDGNGLMEVWIYDDMIYQEDTLKFVKSDTMGINGIGLRNFQSSANPINESYFYIDSIVVWLPTDDASFQSRTKHSIDYKITSPVDIQTREIAYDYNITSEGGYGSTGYPSELSAGDNVRYLIQAGAGETINLEFTSGYQDDGDYLIILDGSDPDDPMLDWIPEAEADYTGALGGDGSVTSSGNELFFYIVLSEQSSGARFQFAVTFNTP